MKNIILITLSAIFISGCASNATSTYSYKEDPMIKVNNEVQVKKSFNIVWDALVRQLAKSFYVVNNIEKESRLINVSFSTQTPEKYINCGRSSRSFKLGNETINYNYEVAADSSYKDGNGKTRNGQASLVAHINRKTSLEGRVNIYIAPSENNSVVSVNVKYILTMAASGNNTAVSIYGQIIQSQAITPVSEIISFSTNQDNKSKTGIVCYSTGLLENEILNMANIK